MCMFLLFLNRDLQPTAPVFPEESCVYRAMFHLETFRGAVIWRIYNSSTVDEAVQRLVATLKLF